MSVIYIDNPSDEERELVWALVVGGLVAAVSRQGFGEVCPTKDAAGKWWAQRKVVGTPYMEVVLA